MLTDDGSAPPSSSTATVSVGAGPTAAVNPDCAGAPSLATADDHGAQFFHDHPPQRAYVLDSFTPAPGANDLLSFTLAAYRAALENRGWRRVMLTDAISGEPGSFRQLWYGPINVITEAEVTTVGQQPFHAEFLAKLKEGAFARERLVAMPYDPSEHLPVDPLNEGPPNAVVINHIKVAPRAMARFAFLKQSFFLPTLQADPFQWRLIAAAAVANNLDTVLQIWELPDLNRLPFTMQRMGQYATYRNCLQPCIAGEDQEVHEAIDWS
jgi:hypothetical protein